MGGGMYGMEQRWYRGVKVGKLKWLLAWPGIVEGDSKAISRGRGLGPVFFFWRQWSRVSGGQSVSRRGTISHWPIDLVLSL